MIMVCHVVLEVDESADVCECVPQLYVGGEFVGGCDIMMVLSLSPSLSLSLSHTHTHTISLPLSPSLCLASLASRSLPLARSLALSFVDEVSLCYLIS